MGWTTKIFAGGVFCGVITAAAVAQQAAQPLPLLNGRQTTPQQPAPPAPATGAAAWARANPQQPPAKNSSTTAHTHHRRKKTSPAEPAPVALAAPVIPPRPSTPGELPPEAPQVSYGNGQMYIVANNSSLAQILRKAADSTGMTIEGAPPDERVFGKFGPAPAGTVLSELLDGTHTNYAILGSDAKHKPTTLVLSAEGAGGTAAGPQPVQQAQNGDEDDDDGDNPPPRPVPFRPINPNPPQNRFNGGNQPRTPEQVLQDLQRRRAQSPESGGVVEDPTQQ